MFGPGLTRALTRPSQNPIPATQGGAKGVREIRSSRGFARLPHFLPRHFCHIMAVAADSDWDGLYTVSAASPGYLDAVQHRHTNLTLVQFRQCLQRRASHLTACRAGATLEGNRDGVDTIVAALPAPSTASISPAPATLTRIWRWRRAFASMASSSEQPQTIAAPASPPICFRPHFCELESQQLIVLILQWLHVTGTIALVTIYFRISCSMWSSYHVLYVSVPATLPWHLLLGRLSRRCPWPPTSTPTNELLVMASASCSTLGPCQSTRVGFS